MLLREVVKKQWVQENRIGHLTGHRGRETFRGGSADESSWAKAGQRKSTQERAEPGYIPMKDILAGHSIFQTHHFGHEECKIN